MEVRASDEDLSKHSNEIYNCIRFFALLLLASDFFKCSEV